MYHHILKRHIIRVLAALFMLIVTAALTLSLGKFLQMIIDYGFLTESRDALNKWIFYFVSISLAVSVGSSVRFFLMTSLGERIAMDLRKTVFAHLLMVPPQHYLTHSPGEVSSRITNDTTLLQSSIGSSLSLFLRNSILLIGGVIWLFVLNFKLTLIALSTIPLAIIPMIIVGRKVRVLSRRTQDKVAGAGAMVTESLRHLKIVQAYERAAKVADDFSATIEHAYSVARSRILLRSVLIFMILSLVLLAIMGMIWVGGMDVLNGKLSPGELAAFVFYTIMVGVAFANVSEVFGELQKALGAFDRLQEVLSWPQIRKEGANLPATTRGMQIEFSDVSFNYPEREERAIAKMSFKIAPGEKITLMGRSGAGKSTLVDLIMGFYEPSGTIRLDGVPVESLNLSYREQIAYLPQDAMLMTGTIRDNVAYGKNVPDEVIWQALDQAAIKDFIERLPEGLNTQAGEAGFKLSGGQRQRIAIARALIRKPRLLILDEPTAHLDPIATKGFFKVLNEAFADTTVLIIAHHEGTIANSERLFIIDNGELVADGTPQTLVEHPIYLRFVE